MISIFLRGTFSADGEFAGFVSVFIKMMESSNDIVYTLNWEERLNDPYTHIICYWLPKASNINISRPTQASTIYLKHWKTWRVKRSSKFIVIPHDVTFISSIHSLSRNASWDEVVKKKSYLYLVGFSITKIYKIWWQSNGSRKRLCSLLNWSI